MGKEGKRLKRCSTSTDVEAADPKGTKPLQKAEITERELQNSETDVNPKKRKKKSESKQIDEDTAEKKNSEMDVSPKKRKNKSESKLQEMKKLRKSFKEMTETMKNLQDFLLSRADLPGISLKEMLLAKAPDTSSKEEEPVEKTKELATYECCFKTEDADGDNDYTLLVKGLDTSLTRDFLKSALTEHFESCGCKVIRVFVPIECETGAPLGFAFVDVDDEQKALEDCKRHMGGRMLYVMMAKYQPEDHAFPNFVGCEHCGTFLLERRLKRFLVRPRY